MGAFACVRLELDTESHYHKSIIIVIGPGSNRSTEAKWKIEFKIHSHRRRRARNLHTASVHLYWAYIHICNNHLNRTPNLWFTFYYTFIELCVCSKFLNFLCRKKEEMKRKKNQYHCNGCGSLITGYNITEGGIFVFFSFAHSLRPYNTTVFCISSKMVNRISNLASTTSTAFHIDQTHHTHARKPARRSICWMDVNGYGFCRCWCRLLALIIIIIARRCVHHTRFTRVWQQVLTTNSCMWICDASRLELCV